MAAINQTATAVVPVANSTFRSGTAGATITAGMPIYIDADDNNELKPARANDPDTAEVAGIAVCNASTGQQVTYQTSGTINLGASLGNSGLGWFLSPDEAGKIVPSSDVEGSGEYMSIIGVSDTDHSVILVLFNSGAYPA